MLPHATRLPRRLGLVPALLACALLPATASASAGPKATLSPEGSLDKDEVRSVVRAHIDEVRRCYNAELSRDPAAHGRIVISFAISQDGSVSKVEATESNLPVEMDTCLVGVISQWTFPAPKPKGTVLVSYPFLFEPG